MCVFVCVVYAYMERIRVIFAHVFVFISQMKLFFKLAVVLLMCLWSVKRVCECECAIGCRRHTQVGVTNIVCVNMSYGPPFAERICVNTFDLVFMLQSVVSW